MVQNCRQVHLESTTDKLPCRILFAKATRQLWWTAALIHSKAAVIDTMVTLLSAVIMGVQQKVEKFRFLSMNFTVHLYVFVFMHIHTEGFYKYHSRKKIFFQYTFHINDNQHIGSATVWWWIDKTCKCELMSVLLKSLYYILLDNCSAI